jgi:RHS repeat-associated protein
MDMDSRSRHLRFRRGFALASGSVFAWSMVLSVPIQALVRPVPKKRAGVRTLTSAEMQKMRGGAGSVPQAGTGSVSTAHVSGSFSGWEIRLGGTVVASAASPNGWSISSTGGGNYDISAPGSAALGSYLFKTSGNMFSHPEGTFDVVQPATSLHSGSAFAWESAPGVPGGLSVGGNIETRRNPFNGNKTTAHFVVGWTARGGMPVSFSLVHNSMSSNNLTLGPKWTHSYDLYGVTNGAGDFTIHWGNDLSYQFTRNVDGSFTPPTGIYDTLVKNGSGTYTLTTKNQIVYEFNTSLRCTSIKDPNNNTITLGYSGNNVITITDPTSRVLTLTYTSGKISSITDPTSRVWNIVYDGSGRVWKVQNPPLSGTTYETLYTYNTAHCITGIQKPRGYRWTYSYFADNSLQWEKDPYNNQVQYQYTTTTKTITDPNGKVTTLTYDTTGRLTQVKDPLNHTENYTYDTSHNRTNVQDKRGYHWAYTYDSKANVLTAKDPYNNTWTYTYNTKHRVLTVTDPLSHVTTYAYAVGNNFNLTSVTTALGHVTTYAYDTNGLLTSVTDPLSHATTYGYNTNGHLTSVTDANSNATTYAVDTLGRVISVTDALSHATTYAYDTWGRVTSVTDANSNATTYAYDVNSNVTSVTNALSRATTFTYDHADRMLTKTKANGNQVSYAYDATGKKGLLSTSTNGNSQTTTYAYTDRRQLSSLTYPDGKVESYTYNANGDLASKTDPKSQTIHYTYDNASRLITIDYPAGTDTSFTYDTANRQTAMTDSTGTWSYSYDNADRNTQITSPNGTVTYTYDHADRRATMAVTGTGTWTYTYDNGDRLTSVQNPYSETTSYAYDTANRLTQVTYANTSKAQYAYDNGDRLTDVWHKKNDNTVLEHFTYAYNNANHITRRTDTNGDVTTFGYDNADQLTSESRTGANSYSITYTYDGNGNRLTKVQGGVTTNYTYQTNSDRLASAGTKSYVYDNNGNCTEVKVSGVTTVTLTYDYENRVTGMTYTGGGSNSFQYNGLNLRTRKVDSAGTFHYVTDGVTPGSDVLKDGAAVYTPGVSERRGTTSKYFQGDHLGSTRAITNSSQTQTDTWIYDAFGRVMTRTGTSVAPFQMAGSWQYQSDTDSGLLLLGHRYYDAEAGRFISVDPIGDGDNWYAYCDNNPLGWVDPEGLQASGGKQLKGGHTKNASPGNKENHEKGDERRGRDQGGEKARRLKPGEKKNKTQPPPPLKDERIGPADRREPGSPNTGGRRQGGGDRRVRDRGPEARKPGTSPGTVAPSVGGAAIDIEATLEAIKGLGKRLWSPLPPIFVLPKLEDIFGPGGDNSA